MNVKLAERLAEAINAAMKEKAGAPLSANDICNHISQAHPELIEQISKEFDLTPELALAWLLARIEGILKNLMLRARISNN